MSVSEEIIKVLEFLCQKVGLAIDWTQAKITENILPYVQELVQRYAQYKIISCGIGSGCGFILIVVGAALLTKVSIAYRKANASKPISNVFMDKYCLSYAGIAALAFAVTSLLVGIPLMICNAVSMVKWIYIPDVQMVHTIVDYLNNKD